MRGQRAARSGRRRTSLAGVALAGVICLLLAACGGGGSSASADGERVTVKVGILPITSAAALMLGEQKGFFADEGLDLETHEAQSGAALVPAVASGQYQFGFSNNVSLLIAYGKGLPVRIVRSANSAGTDPSPSQESLVVSNESGIESVQDLAGKTIAVNSLNNTPQLACMTTLENAGVDPSTVEFVEVGFPEMPLALQQGRVDAADISEPFLTEAVANGGKELASPYREVQQDLHISSWFTTQQYIDSDEDVVQRFARAVDKSNAYAQGHSDEVRNYVTKYLDIERSTAQEMALPGYPEGTTTVETLQQLAAGAKRFGFVQQPPSDVGALIAGIQ
jgi:NitT/TauT family transport system substrate-binding protein